MNESIKEKKYLISKINYFLITILPATLLVGSLISNVTVVLICIFFIFDLILRKENFIFKDKNFYFLILIYFYLILNSFFSGYPDAFYKSLSFIRFILLAYALSFYFKVFNNSFLKIWALIFIVVTFDILFEFSFGKNILGNESNYNGRIASFTGDELKIGGYYFGFLFICLAFFKDNKKLFALSFIVFFLIALIIGERSNFLKVSIMYFFYLLFFINISYFKKILIIFLLSILGFLAVTNAPYLKGNYSKINILKLNQITQSEYGDYLTGLLKNYHHFAHYYTATQIFKENIIFGKGFKSFRVESYNENYFKGKLDFSVGLGATHPHQLHFEILAELGIVGYILILSNLIFVIMRNKKFNNEFLSKSGTLFIIATLIPMLPSGSFFTSYVATIFFINYSFLIKTNTSNLN